MSPRFGHVYHASTPARCSAVHSVHSLCTAQHSSIIQHYCCCCCSVYPHHQQKREKLFEATHRCVFAYRLTGIATLASILEAVSKALGAGHMTARQLSCNGLGLFRRKRGVAHRARVHGTLHLDRSGQHSTGLTNRFDQNTNRTNEYNQHNNSKHTETK